MSSKRTWLLALEQDSGFSTTPTVIPGATPPENDFPRDDSVTAESTAPDAEAVDTENKADAVPEKAPEAISQNPDAPEPELGEDANHKQDKWQLLYAAMLDSASSHTISATNEQGAGQAKFNHTDNSIQFFDHTGQQKQYSGSATEQLKEHFKDFDPAKLSVTPSALPTPQSPNPEPEKFAPAGAAQMVIAPTAAAYDASPPTNEARYPVAAPQAPHSLHGPSMAIASSLAGAAALPFSVLAAANDMVKNFRERKQQEKQQQQAVQAQQQQADAAAAPQHSAPDTEATQAVATANALETIAAKGPAAENGTEPIPAAPNGPAIDASPSEPISPGVTTEHVAQPAEHEPGLAGHLEKFNDAVDRFNATPEMQAVDKALERYTPEHREKAKSTDPEVARMIHEAVKANPEIVDEIVTHGKAAADASESLDEESLSVTSPDAAKTTQAALNQAAEKSKSLPNHKIFDDVKDKISNAFSKLGEKLSELLSKIGKLFSSEKTVSAAPSGPSPT